MTRVAAFLCVLLLAAPASALAQARGVFARPTRARRRPESSKQLRQEKAATEKAAAGPRPPAKVERPTSRPRFVRGAPGATVGRATLAGGRVRLAPGSAFSVAAFSAGCLLLSVAGGLGSAANAPP